MRTGQDGGVHVLDQAESASIAGVAAVQDEAVGDRQADAELVAAQLLGDVLVPARAEDDRPLVRLESAERACEILRPHVRIDENEKSGKVIIGVIEGDTHDIGKNLVKMMLETSGFDVVDLGRDVPPAHFVERAREVEADIIAVSTLMTTTMEGMAEVIAILRRENLRGRFKVIVGGGPISAAFARKIGADGYSPNAASAARLAKTLLREPQEVG